MRAVPGLVIVALALAGCGTGDDRDQARATVERFYAAVQADRGDDACAQLADATVEALESQSGQSCERVVTRLDYEPGPVERTQVYITSAKVDLRGDESAFLDREPEGWRISGAGCRPVEGKPRDRPLDCEADA
jgi:hypothetical protein